MAVEDPDPEDDRMYINIRMVMIEETTSELEAADSSESDVEITPNDTGDEVQNTVDIPHPMMADCMDTSHPPVPTRRVKQKGRKDGKKRPSSVPRAASEKNGEVHVEGLDVNAVVSKRLKLSSEDDPLPTIKSHLLEESDRITEGKFENKRAYANPEGHSLLDSMNQMMARVENLTSKLDENIKKNEERAKENEEQKKGIKAHTTQISSLTQKLDESIKKSEEQVKKNEEQKIRLDELVKCSEDCKKFRRRILEVFKRDTFRPFDRQRIIDGNVIAHFGDVIADAVIYRDEGRTDTYIFRELYGLDYQEVLYFHERNTRGDGGLFYILNIHATWLLDIEKPNSPALEAAFSVFLTRLQANWPHPPIQYEYDRFLRVRNQEEPRL